MHMTARHDDCMGATVMRRLRTTSLAGALLSDLRTTPGELRTRVEATANLVEATANRFAGAREPAKREEPTLGGREWV